MIFRVNLKKNINYSTYSNSPNGPNSPNNNLFIIYSILLSIYICRKKKL